MASEDICPRSYDCASLNLSTDYVSFDTGPIPTYVSLVSSTFSCAGAVLLLASHFALPKQMHSTIRCIVTLLAVSDLISALGYIVGAINYLNFFQVRGERCFIFGQICAVQSFVTTWFSISSFFWTCILTIHFFLVIRYEWPRRRGPDILAIYNVVAWVVPLAVALPYLATRRLGYSVYGALNWCVVRDSDRTLQQRGRPREMAALALVGPVWEIVSYAVIVSFSLIVFCKLRQMAAGQRPVWRRLKLLCIPLLFVLLRVWGTLHFFLSVATWDNVTIATTSDGFNYCISSRLQILFFVIGILQAIGDAGQGWGNAIIYLILFSRARNKLFCHPTTQLCATCCNLGQSPSIDYSNEDGSYQQSRRRPTIHYNRHPVPHYGVTGGGTFKPGVNDSPAKNISPLEEDLRDTEDASSYESHPIWAVVEM